MQKGQAQWNHVLDTLRQRGWQEQMHSNNSEWWVIQQVILSRAAETLTATLLTDPQDDSFTSVSWAIAFDATFPESRLDTGKLALLTLSMGWERRLEQIFRNTPDL